MHINEAIDYSQLFKKICKVYFVKGFKNNLSESERYQQTQTEGKNIQTISIGAPTTASRIVEWGG